MPSGLACRSVTSCYRSQGVAWKAVSTPSQPERDRLLISQIYGETSYHAPRRELIADDHAMAGCERCERAEQARAG